MEKTKLRYLALGDSLAAGFNIKLAKDLKGKYFDETVPQLNYLSGVSYPAFFVHFVQEINQQIITTFDNFALSGSKLSDWIALLKTKQSAFFKSQWNSQFESHLQNFLVALKSANIITVSLGANDYLEAFFEFLPQIFLASKKSYSDFFAKLKVLIKKTYQEIAQNLVIFSQLLKKENQKAKVYYLDYPLPLLRLSMAIDQLAKKFFNNFEYLELPDLLNLFQNQSAANDYSLSNVLISSLNNLIKDTVVKNGLGKFINIYQKNEWIWQGHHFAKNIFDIHPSALGHKKIAFNLLIETTNILAPVKSLNNKISKRNLNNWYNDETNKNSSSQKLINFTKEELYNWWIKNQNYTQRLINQEKRINYYLDYFQYHNYLQKTTFLLFSWKKRFLNIVSQYLENHTFFDSQLNTLFKDFKDYQKGQLLEDLYSYFVNSYFLQKMIVKIQREDDQDTKILGFVFDLHKILKIAEKHFYDRNNYLDLLKSLILLTQKYPLFLGQQLLKLIALLLKKKELNAFFVNRILFKRKSTITKHAVLELLQELIAKNEINDYLEKVSADIFAFPNDYLDAGNIRQMFIKLVERNQQIHKKLMKTFFEASFHSPHRDVLIGLISKEIYALIKLASLHKNTKITLERNLIRFFVSLNNPHYLHQLYLSFLNNLKDYEKLSIVNCLLKATRDALRKYLF